MTAWQRSKEGKRNKSHHVLTDRWLFVMDWLVTRIHDVTVHEFGAGDVFRLDYYRLGNGHRTARAEFSLGLLHARLGSVGVSIRLQDGKDLRFSGYGN